MLKSSNDLDTKKQEEAEKRAAKKLEGERKGKMRKTGYGKTAEKDKRSRLRSAGRAKKSRSRSTGRYVGEGGRERREGGSEAPGKGEAALEEEAPHLGQLDVHDMDGVVRGGLGEVHDNQLDVPDDGDDVVSLEEKRNEVAGEEQGDSVRGEEEKKNPVMDEEGKGVKPSSAGMVKRPGSASAVARSAISPPAAMARTQGRRRGNEEEDRSAVQSKPETFYKLDWVNKDSLPCGWSYRLDRYLTPVVSHTILH